MYNVTFRLCGIFTAIVLLFTTGLVQCSAYYNSDTTESEAIILDNVALSQNKYYTTIKLSGYNGQSGKIVVKQYDTDGKKIKTDQYTPSKEIALEFGNVDDLDSVEISWLKDNALICEPVTIKLNIIYAADWQDLATAINRMDRMYAGKVTVEDDSRDYASGRLIVKSEEELLDLLEFDISMIVVDDEDHYFLQFDKSSEAKKCADYLKKQPGIEYVDIDSVVVAS